MEQTIHTIQQNRWVGSPSISAELYAHHGPSTVSLWGHQVPHLELDHPGHLCHHTLLTPFCPPKIPSNTSLLQLCFNLLAGLDKDTRERILLAVGMIIFSLIWNTKTMVSGKFAFIIWEWEYTQSCVQLDQCYFTVQITGINFECSLYCNSTVIVCIALLLHIIWW